MALKVRLEGSNTDPHILDVGLEPHEEWRVDTTSGNELFICVYDGTIESVNKRGNCCKAEAPAIILFEGDGDVIVAAQKVVPTYYTARGVP